MRRHPLDLIAKKLRKLPERARSQKPYKALARTLESAIAEVRAAEEQSSAGDARPIAVLRGDPQDDGLLQDVLCLRSYVGWVWLRITTRDGLPSQQNHAYSVASVFPPVKLGRFGST